MEPNETPKTPGGSSKKPIVLLAALVLVVLIAIGATVILKNRNPQVSTPDPIAQVASTHSANQTVPETSAPLYHKKQLVYKRVVGESDLAAIRSSARTGGYKALASIPPIIVAPQISLRTPQFLTNTAMRNYQALSTLGTTQYYSNQNVQQFLNNLSNQQFVNDLAFRQFSNNLETQRYLSNLNFQLNTQNRNFQQYLTDLNLQTFQTNLNFQTYLNNFNLNNQTYLNNWNTLNNPSTYQPNFYTPPVQIYTPPMQFYTPPMQFYNPPMQFYNPPPIRNFP
jgi:hypothetical protein